MNLTKKEKVGMPCNNSYSISESTVYLLSVYDKGEKEMLSNGELEEFVTLMRIKDRRSTSSSQQPSIRPQSSPPARRIAYRIKLP